MTAGGSSMVQVKVSPRLGEQLLSRRVHLQDPRHGEWTAEELAAILLARAYADGQRASSTSA